MKDPVNQIVLLVIAICLISFFGIDLGPDNDPKPDPTPPGPVVDSPFPENGYWLLLSAEADQLSGVSVIHNAGPLGSEPDLESRCYDYQQNVTAPWQTALDYANQKSGGTPYFVARKGSKAREGKLTGGVDEMMDAVVKAIEDIR